jgi:uncharacterized protein YpuA (DUF1002 family)
VNTTSLPSTNEIAAASSHNVAGAANGNHRRPSRATTTSAIAGTANHTGLVGASAASLRRATSSALSTAATTIRMSSPNLRADNPIPCIC